MTDITEEFLSAIDEIRLLTNDDCLRIVHADIRKKQSRVTAHAFRFYSEIESNIINECEEIVNKM